MGNFSIFQISPPVSGSGSGIIGASSRTSGNGAGSGSAGGLSSGTVSSGTEGVSSVGSVSVAGGSSAAGDSSACVGSFVGVELSDSGDPASKTLTTPLSPVGYDEIIIQSNGMS